MSSNPITVQILDKEYRIACPAGEEDALRESATFLNKRIIEVRESGKVIGPDRITVMAALNLAHEFLSERSEHEQVTSNINTRVRTLHERIDNAIRSSNQLEL
ncbi:MAG: cell division protein ZapA [Gammaproteobacteria bacterium]|nr:cell division protein ZapA [Gammaproteobacteria bacterium]